MEGDTTNCADNLLIASWSGLKLLIADGMIVPIFKRLIGCGANAITEVSPLGALLREGQSLSAAKLPRGSDWDMVYDGRASLLIMFILSVYRSVGIGATFSRVVTDILVSGTGDLIFTTLRRRCLTIYRIPPILIATIAVPPTAKPMGNARPIGDEEAAGVGVDGLKFASKFE